MGFSAVARPWRGLNRIPFGKAEPSLTALFSVLQQDVALAVLLMRAYVTCIMRRPHQK